MDYVRFYREINAKNQIEKLAKKYKKIIIYGAGLMSEILFSEYSEALTKLNVVAVSDIKYTDTKNETFFGIPAISPDKIDTCDFDCILVNLRIPKSVINSLIDRFIGTEHENKFIGSLFKVPLMYILRYVIF